MMNWKDVKGSCRGLIQGSMRTLTWRTQRKSMASKSWELYVLPALLIRNCAFCIYVPCIILRVNRDPFVVALKITVCNGEVSCFLCGTNWILKILFRQTSA